MVSIFKDKTETLRICWRTWDDQKDQEDPNRKQVEVVEIKNLIAAIWKLNRQVKKQIKHNLISIEQEDRSDDCKESSMKKL